MYNHILVPVAPGDSDKHAESFATARKLLVEGGKLSVVSVLEEIPSYVVDAYMPAGQMEKNIAAVSNEMNSEFAQQDVDVHVISGHSVNSILDWADNNGADCIVISSHRPGFSDYLIGSTAARVVRHAKCSVVVLR